MNFALNLDKQYIPYAAKAIRGKYRSMKAVKCDDGKYNVTFCGVPIWHYISVDKALKQMTLGISLGKIFEPDILNLDDEDDDLNIFNRYSATRKSIRTRNYTNLEYKGEN